MESQQDWEIKLVRDRYRWLKLTPAQARAVWEMEKEDTRMRTGINESLSYWEQMDRDYDRWQAILKPEQFKLWEPDYKKSLKDHEKHLIREDAGKLKEIEFHEEYIGWVRKTFLPRFYKDVGTDGVLVRHSQKDRIEYLCAEFKAYRWRQSRRLVASHYRHCRRFQPNELRLSLLRDELWSLLPDYYYFIRQADEGVKAVGKLLLNDQRTWFAAKGELLVAKLTAAGEQYKLLREKYFGDETPREGWHFVIERQSDLTPAEDAWMSYLLMEDAPQSVWDVIPDKHE